jgi:glutamate-1-semialdehyde 2,1-aminomutase
MEPINYDAGCILPHPGFVQRVREIATEWGVLLLFDEVLTAFRMARGGAQEYLGVTPDIAVLGKALGGGLPISAITGKRAIMEHLRPVGEAEHSGTYMAHLIPVMGSLAALEEMDRPGFYERLNQLGDQFYGGVNDIIRRTGARARLQHCGPRFFIYFGVDPDQEITNYRMAARHDQQMAIRFVKEMLNRGIYFHDYGGKVAHHGFSVAHSASDLDMVLAAMETAMQRIQE